MFKGTNQLISSVFIFSRKKKLISILIPRILELKLDGKTGNVLLNTLNFWNLNKKPIEMTNHSILQKIVQEQNYISQSTH